MKMISFTAYQGQRVSFVADKIICVMANDRDPKTTSIFVMSAGGESDEFIVRESYEQVCSILGEADEAIHYRRREKIP